MKTEATMVVRYPSIRVIGWLGDVTIEHVPRKENRQADALAKTGFHTSFA